MIFIEPIGGLGNQMFQYAAAFSLSCEKKTTVGICLKKQNEVVSDKNFTRRSFELARVFNLDKFEFVDKSKYEYIITPEKSIWNKIKSKIRRASFFYEKTLRFEGSFFDLTSEAFIEGYFQSPKYFEMQFEKLKKHFTFRLTPSDKTNILLDQISKTDSVAVHVRRGDFVKSPINLQKHGVCSVEYYKAAVSEFLAIEDRQFVIVSDDPDWVKLNLDLGLNTLYVDWNSGNDSWQDMLIISKCKNAIIANSSFSWWGAMLIDNPQKKIVAPEIWYADKELQKQTIDLIPASWIRK